MRCLVTGASGQLGSYLTRLLVSKGEQVTVLVRPSSNLWRLEGIEERLTIIHGDLESIDASRDQIIKSAPEAVFHLAWFGVTAEHRNDEKQILDNVIGSLNLFRIIQAAGCKCWVGLGSQAEYGPYSEALTESLPAKPITSYGVAKLSVGLLTQKLCELAKMRYVWLRLLATYGPKDDDKHLIPSVILKLLSNEKPSLTPGEQKWDYLYAEDAAEAIYKCAMQSDVSGVFNLGFGNSYSVRSIVEKIRNFINPSLPLGIGEVPYRSDQVMLLQTKLDKIQNSISWQPEVNLEEGLKRTVEWYKKERMIP